MFISQNKFIIGLVIIIFLSACGVNHSDTIPEDQASTGIALPKIITHSRLPETGTINAYISVDGGARQTMKVNGSSASITLNKIKKGTHNFTIIIEYLPNSDPGNPITLVETTKSITISSGSNAVLTFTDEDHTENYNASDDDGDGVGNLFELLTDNAYLADIELSAGELDQVFDPKLVSYDTSVGYLARSTQITAIAQNENATIEIEGVSTITGQASDLISLIEGENLIEIVVTSADASTSETYFLVISRQDLAAFAQQAYLKASNTEANDFLGRSVALSGDTLVVGADNEDSGTTGVNSAPDNSALDSGAVYVYTRTAGSWSQQAYIKASNTGAGDHFGESVALSGDTLVVGARREDSSSTGVNSTPDNSALDSGAVYVYTRTADNWNQQAYIKASNTGAGDLFGESVAIFGDTLAIGAIAEDSGTTGVNSTPNEVASDSGAVYVYTRTDDNWNQQAYIKASNTGADDLFGESVALYEDTLAVGAIFEDSGTTGVNSTPDEGASAAGAVYVYTRTADNWSQQAYIKASNTGAGDGFGRRVALSGDTLAVGASGEDSSSTGVDSTPDDSALGSGAVYVFSRMAGIWDEQAYIKASNTGTTDEFGSSIALSGDTLAVGASLEDSGTTGINSIPDDTVSESGAAYVFTRMAGIWSQQVYIKASNTGTIDDFGWSVALSGDTLAVGALREDSNGVASNPESDDSAPGAGAVYVFQ